MIEKLSQLSKDIHQNVWAVIVLVIGALLCVAKHDDAGKMALGGGLTLLKSNPDKEQ